MSKSSLYSNVHFVTKALQNRIISGGARHLIDTRYLLSFQQKSSLPYCTTSEDVKQSENKVKALYDGKCPICVKEIQLLEWRNKKSQTMEFVDIAEPGYDPSQNAGVTYERGMEEMHVIDKDNKVYTGVEAFQVMYSAVGWSWAVNWTHIPVLRKAADAAYVWFAKNRLWLTGRKPDCDTGACDTKLQNRFKTKSEQKNS